MVLERIETTVDVTRTPAAHAVIVGSANSLAEGWVRSGLGTLTVIDFDRWHPVNLARQDCLYKEAKDAKFKADAMADNCRAINPEVDVRVHRRDLCSMSEEELEKGFRGARMVVGATDFLPAQARLNQIALWLGIPAMFLGLYAEGRGGEILVVDPKAPESGCFRCVHARRYAAFAEGGAHVSSRGGTIFDINLLDAIAGQVGLGVLTRGSDNRFGRLIDQMGDRRLLVVKHDPEFRVDGRDIFAERLGSGRCNFSFTTIAIPTRRDPDCLDCAQYRGGEGR